MEEIKIIRLPASAAHPPAHVPEATKDSRFETRELEALAQDLYVWAQDPEAELPELEGLLSAEYRARYKGAFDPYDLERRLEEVIKAIYPVGEHLFLAHPERHYETRCTGVLVRRKEVSDRVYWKRELTVGEEAAWLAGYRGPSDERAWEADPLRPAYEKELAVLTAHIYAKAANTVHYPAALYYAMPGWPLAIRIR